jgi:hypothetical protein
VKLPGSRRHAPFFDNSGQRAQLAQGQITERHGHISKSLQTSNNSKFQLMVNPCQRELASRRRSQAGMSPAVLLALRNMN